MSSEPGAAQIDIFSLRAIENIRISIEKWKKQLVSAVKSTEYLESLPKNIQRDCSIKFLGYVTQQYISKKMDGTGERRAVDAYEKIMKKVAPTIRANFIERLQPNFDDEYLLGTIPNLYSLIPMSQFARRPIFALRAKDGVRGAHFNKVKEAEDLFQTIAERLEENIEEFESLSGRRNSLRILRVVAR